METNQRVWVEVTSGYRLSCPVGCPNEVHEIMLSCWHTTPPMRPSFEEVKRRVSALETDIPENSSQTFTNDKEIVIGQYVPSVARTRASSNAPQFMYQQPLLAASTSALEPIQFVHSRSPGVVSKFHQAPFEEESDHFTPPLIDQIECSLPYLTRSPKSHQALRPTVLYTAVDSSNDASLPPIQIIDPHVAGGIQLKDLGPEAYISEI
jgi:hypothetical protein